MKSRKSLKSINITDLQNLKQNDKNENYSNFNFHKQEWDNVPSVVPRFIIHLEKQIEKQYEFNK